MKSLSVSLAAFLSIFIILVGPSHAEQILDDAQIRDLLVGKSAIFTDLSFSSYEKTGTYSYVYPDRIALHGKYEIRGGQVCVTFTNKALRCDKVARDAVGPYMITAEGAHFRFSTIGTIASARQDVHCGVPVAYTLITPEPSVAEQMKAFSGVWIGNWDYGACTALIVESIRDDGSVSIVLIQGEFGGEYRVKASAKRFPGVIVNGVLKSDGPINYVHYTLDAEGLRVAAGGSAVVIHGRLKKATP